MAGPGLQIRYAARAVAWGYIDNVLLTYWHEGMSVALAQRYVQDSIRTGQQAAPG